ncbi:hypothetical protein [Halobaculum gomorrense]|uniref:DUF8106 domain-containing protein n=1 Tax=Halobaculum gomorrense TaxID=43928 RepID=A0A1M5SZQ1_9EURY|nr:hypothetical protein [Halobaculum gomorrense]SHH43969.1 hypothetical protein SAMN05443636_2588 [Halobaculum gomorrense]
MDDPSTPSPRPPPKNTLFCPECGHAAPADGDWVVRDRDRDGVEALTCPDCGATLTVRRSKLAPPA